MNWAVIIVEQGRTRAVQNNLVRLGIQHYIPMEVRLVRRSRLTKTKELKDYPVLSDKVFIEWDQAKINRFLGTKYTLRAMVDQNEVVLRVPDNQMAAFMGRIESWNEGIMKQYNSGQAGNRKKRNEWRKMTLESLGALNEVLFDVKEAA